LILDVVFDLSSTIHGARLGVYITIEFRRFVEAGLAAATSYTVSMYDQFATSRMAQSWSGSDSQQAL